MKNLSTKDKLQLNKITSVSKILIRSCLIALFFILISLFGILAICWGDSLYNASRGVSKNPLFNTYVIVTESMVPTINVNDVIVVKRAKKNTLTIGDIITFSSNNMYMKGLTVTHRVVGKKLDVDGNYIYRTKGDNNSLEDTALVNLDNIYGKVIFKIPKMGYVRNFIASTFGFILSIVLPVLLVVFYEIWRIIRVLKKQYAEVEIL